MSEPRTFDVQLVQPDGAIGAGGYASQNGEVPAVDEVIPVDEHGGCARVTELNGEVIRAELVSAGCASSSSAAFAAFNARSFALRAQASGENHRRVPGGPPSGARAQR